MALRMKLTEAWPSRPENNVKSMFGYGPALFVSLELWRMPDRSRRRGLNGNPWSSNRYWISANSTSRHTDLRRASGRPFAQHFEGYFELG